MLTIQLLPPKADYASNCYLLGCDGAYAVIDPSADYAEVLAQHPQIAHHLKYVLITHAHFDHILTLDTWAEAAERVIIGEADGPSLSDPFFNCYLMFMHKQDGYFGRYDTVRDGDMLPLGSKTITVIDAPGHTRGGVCYAIDDALFCGDTVFASGGHGICHVPGADFDTLCQSIRHLIAITPDTTEVYPGHGPHIGARRLKAQLALWL